MSCPMVVVPFPLCRRQAFVRRHAAIMASLSPSAAERHLDNQVRIQVAALLRRGIERGLIEQERQCLARAVRAELAQIGISHGGAA